MTEILYSRGRVKPYNVVETAHLLGVSKSTLYDACNRGEVPHVKIGGRLLIPASFVDRAINGPEQNAA